jgi:hypothetical protein
MAARAMILVPPFLKYVSGPLLGPAMLAGAGQQAGHHVQVLDLNARWIRDELPAGIAVEPQQFLGDHDRPSDILRRLQPALDAARLARLAAGGCATLEVGLETLEPGSQRLSPMGREPARYGLVVTERWPWATVLGWRASTHAQPRRAGAAGRAADSLSGRSSAWPT